LAVQNAYVRFASAVQFRLGFVTRKECVMEGALLVFYCGNYHQIDDCRLSLFDHQNLWYYQPFLSGERFPSFDDDFHLGVNHSLDE